MLTRWIMTVGLILIVAFVASTMLQGAQAREELAVARADLIAARRANAEHERTIARLREQAEFDAQLLRDLNTMLGNRKRDLDAAQAALEELRRTSSDVASYLDAPVPPELRRMYDPAA